MKESVEILAAKRKNRRLRAGITVILLCAVVGAFAWWSWASQAFSASGNSVKITITSGTTASQLADALEQNRVIRSALFFRCLVKLQGSDFKMYAGNYELTPNMTPEAILKSLSAGGKSYDSVKLTIPEGYSTQQVIDLLVEKGLGSQDEFTQVVENDDFPYTFLTGAPKGVHRLEGFLSPNTYFLAANTTPHDIIDTFLKQFAKGLTPDVQNQLASRKLTVMQWVTMASLIEKEAVKDSDRPLIASVIVNRLKINKPLQIDATIQFLLGTPKPKLYDTDLKIPSPYNTYLHTGLPPGPIANPGEASLQAALNPAQTNYLYYVAKKDGYHAFAATYAEHLKNIKLYQ